MTNKTKPLTYEQCCADAPNCVGHGGHHAVVRRILEKHPLTPADVWFLHLGDCMGCTAIGPRCTVGDKLFGGKVYRKRWAVRS